jgi:hypothetical protein
MGKRSRDIKWSIGRYGSMGNIQIPIMWRAYETLLEILNKEKKNG